MVKKRESKQRTRGKSFIEWCTENGERGERLANEFKDPDKLPTEVCKASTYKALWKCLKCKHAWRAMVCNRTKSDTPTGCPKCAKHASASKIKNFLEYVDPDRKPTSVTKGSHHKALWKCLKCMHSWRTKVHNRTDSDKPTGCPNCNKRGRKGKRRRDD
eukprot:31275-Pelagococcus_subviridis.AAC.2